jgi:hypothetical protein
VALRWALRPVMPRAGGSAPGIGCPAFYGGAPRGVEAGGQHIRGFRRGLDYAFVRALQGSAWTRSVLSGCHGQLDPSARPGRCAVGGSMSLYRAGLRLALFLPLGVAMPPL